MPSLALFDFDGTITRSDTFAPFIRSVTPLWRLAIGYIALAPLIIGWRLRVIGASPLRRGMIFVAFAGRREDTLRRLGERYAQQTLPYCLIPDVMTTISQYKSRGDTVVIVSASLDLYLKPWCAAHNIDLLCTTLASILTALCWISLQIPGLE